MDNVTLNRKLTFQVKNNSYTVEFPTVGQFIDIESLKVSVSKGEYGNLIRSGTSAGFDALELIDVACYFKVLCPKLAEDLGRPYEDLDAIDFLELRQVYREKIKPWLNGWYKLFKEKDDNQE